MADFSGCHFIYGDKSSREFGLYFANADTERMTSLYGNKEGVFISNKKDVRRILIDDNYEDSHLTFDVEILTDNDRCLNGTEQKEIVNWLFFSRGFKNLFIDLQDDRFAETYDLIDGKRYRKYLRCRFINPEKMEYNGGIVGYKATLEADSHMFWQEPITKVFSLDWTGSEEEKTIVIDVDTDWDGYIYPEVTITTKPGTQKVEIRNRTDNPERLTSFANSNKVITVKMDGSVNYIKDHYELFEKRNFIRLLRGRNEIVVNKGVTEIKFEYAQRKVL